jgi:hypothetical protein
MHLHQAPLALLAGALRSCTLWIASGRCRHVTAGMRVARKTRDHARLGAWFRRDASPQTSVASPIPATFARTCNAGCSPTTDNQPTSRANRNDPIPVGTVPEARHRPDASVSEDCFVHDRPGLTFGVHKTVTEFFACFFAAWRLRVSDPCFQRLRKIFPVTGSDFPRHRPGSLRPPLVQRRVGPTIRLGEAVVNSQGRIRPWNRVRPQ